jgi:hypothetical protein
MRRAARKNSHCCLLRERGGLMEREKDPCAAHVSRHAEEHLRSWNRGTLSPPIRISISSRARTRIEASTRTSDTAIDRDKTNNFRSAAPFSRSLSFSRRQRSTQGARSLRLETRHARVSPRLKRNRGGSRHPLLEYTANSTDSSAIIKDPRSPPPPSRGIESSIKLDSRCRPVCRCEPFVK